MAPVANFFGDVGKAVTSTVGDLVTGHPDKIGQDISNGVSNVAGDIGSGFQSVAQAGSALISGNLGGAVGDVLGTNQAPAAQPFSPLPGDPQPLTQPSGGGNAAGGAGGFGGNFNSLASGADPNNANSLLGIQQQADQQQTMLELAAKLESMQKETDQFIIQNL